MQTTPDVPQDRAQETLVSADALRDLLTRIYIKLGLFKVEAEMAAARQIDADLRGIHSHGSRATPRYVSAIDLGEIDPRGQTIVVQKTVATALLDGGRNLGHVASTKAMQMAIEMARECGTGTVAVRNSHHYGASSAYALMAAAAGFIGFTTTNTGGATVLGYGSKQAATANNAFAWAVPAQSGPPFCLDMACAVSSWGKLDSWKLYGKPIPDDWAVNAEGEPTNDPHQAKMLQPAAGARGYGLAILCAILTGGLSGGKFPLEKTRHPDREGSEHFFYVLDPARFGERDEFLAHMAAALGQIRDLAPAVGVDSVRVPGDLEHARCAEWKANGIPLHHSHLAELELLASRWKLPCPWTRGG